MRICLTLCLLLVAGATGAVAADNGSYYIGSTQGVDVHSSPSTSGQVSGHLDRLTDVKVLQRTRGWAEIEVSQPRYLRGWVIEGAVRQRYQPSTSQKAKSSFFSSFARMFGGNEPQQQQTAVLGVRGLDEESNAAGEARNTKAVQWMESLNVSQDEVDRFVRDGRLNP